MITVDQIRSVVQQVILSKISLDDFDEWLTKASWNMHQDSSAEAISMVGQVELALADYDSGLISVSDVMQALRKQVPVVVITNVSTGVTIITSGSAACIVANPPLVQWAASGTRSSSGFSYTLVPQE